ncbi:MULTISPECIES: SRPBCC family protein [Pirellulaceae]|uniref:SRPBCC family protein n=1 Tax=Pirellulaceae TaxID=2691357 RepID=UPI0018EC25B3|nr:MULTISPECIES: SRPBCC domain-containing protein [Pirellulaceae]
MSESIRRELHLPQPPEEVWDAIANRESLADWMYPNTFEPIVGHHFNFHVPPNPKVGFEGIVVRCEVLTCEPPKHLEFSWSALNLIGTTVRFLLEPAGEGTLLRFEHAGFDLTQPGVEQAFKGANFGWGKMLEKLATIIADSSTDHS